MRTRVIATGFDPSGPFAGMWLPPAFRKRQAETRFRQEWRLTLEQYVAMMLGKPAPSKRRQRGSIILASAGPAASGGFVKLTNHFVVGSGSPTATAGWFFNRDGSLVCEEDGVPTVQPKDEWFSIHPIAAVGDDFEVRALSAGKTGIWDTAAAADDIWITINATREWGISSMGSQTTIATFEVRRDGVESALDSGVLDTEVDAL